MSEQFKTLAQLKEARHFKVKGTLIVEPVPGGWKMLLLTEHGDKFTYVSDRDRTNAATNKVTDSFRKLARKHRLNIRREEQSETDDSFVWEVQVLEV